MTNILLKKISVNRFKSLRNSKLIDFYNHILFFSIRRTLNSEDSKIRLTPAPSEANIAIKYVLEGEDMVKIGSKYGENSIPMISFFLEKQRELGIPIIIPMGKNSNNPKQPNFQTLEHFERNSILHLDNPEKIYKYLNEKPYHTLGINLGKTDFTVVDVDSNAPGIRNLVLSYAKRTKGFFLVEQTPRGYHLWGIQPRHRCFQGGRRIKANVFAGFDCDVLSNGMCILPLGEKRKVWAFSKSEDYMKPLLPMFWPVNNLETETRSDIQQGDRFATAQKRLLKTKEAGIPISWEEMVLVNQINFTPEKDESSLRFAYDQIYGRRNVQNASQREILVPFNDLSQNQDFKEIKKFFEIQGWDLKEDILNIVVGKSLATLSIVLEDLICPNIRLYQEEWWGFNEKKGRWLALDKDDLERIIYCLIRFLSPELYRKKNKDDCMDILAKNRDVRITREEYLENYSKYIQFKENIYNVYNLKDIKKPTRDFFCIEYKDFELNLDSKPQKMFALWEKTFENFEEVKRFLRIVFFLLIRRDAYLHDIFIEVVGREGSGKSLLIRFFIAVLGIKKVADINFSHLETEKFSLQSCTDKNLLLIQECPKFLNEMPSTFKKITSGDLTKVGVKYKEDVYYFLRTLICIVGNEDVIFSGLDSQNNQERSIKRRRMTLNFVGIPRRTNSKLLYVDLKGDFRGTLIEEIPKIWGWALSLSDENVKRSLERRKRTVLFPSIAADGKIDIKGLKKINRKDLLQRREREYILNNVIEDFLTKNVVQGREDEYILSGFKNNEIENSNSLFSLFLKQNKSILKELGCDIHLKNYRQKLPFKTIKTRLEVLLHKVFITQYSATSKKAARFYGIKLKN